MMSSEVWKKSERKTLARGCWGENNLEEKKRCRTVKGEMYWRVLETKVKVNVKMYRWMLREKWMEKRTGGCWWKNLRKKENVLDGERKNVPEGVESLERGGREAWGLWHRLEWDPLTPESNFHDCKYCDKSSDTCRRIIPPTGWLKLHFGTGWNGSFSHMRVMFNCSWLQKFFWSLSHKPSSKRLAQISFSCRPLISTF